MDVVPYHPSYEGALYELVRSHIRQVPPFIELQRPEFTDMLHHPFHMTDAYYGSFERNIETWIAMQDGELIAALQLTFPDESGVERADAEADSQVVHINWLFGEPEREGEIRSFYETMVRLVQERNCRELQTIRNPFGIGWTGIPDCWPHLLKAMAGFGEDDIECWQSYWTNSLNGAPLPSRLTMQPDIRVQELQLHYDFLHHGNQAGELDLWLPSARAVSLTEAGAANMEWIEVDECWRGKRLGQAMIASAAAHCATYGVRQWICWTMWDSMRKLAVRSGFQQGPSFHWITTRLETWKLAR